MKLAKCPRCELNYMRPGETLCDVCKRELGKKHSKEDSLEICPSCNEHSVVPGEELCKFCLREKMRLENAELLSEADDDEKDIADAEIEEDEPLDPQELADIEIDPLDEEIPEGDLNEIDSEFELEDEEEDEELEEDSPLFDEQ